MPYVGEIAAELFNKIVRTPRVLTSIIVLLILYHIPAIFMYSNYFRYLALTVAPTFTLLIITSYMLYHNTSFYKVKSLGRTLSYIFYSTLTFIPSYTLILILNHVFKWNLSPELSYISLNFLHYTFQRSTTNRSPLRVGLYSLASTLPFSILSLKYSIEYYAMFAFGSIIIMIASETYLQTINYKSIRFNNINPLNLFRGFALEWLADDSSLLESLLEEISEVRNGWVKAYLFKCGERGFAVVQTIFHSGPIRDVGGALIVKRISRSIKEGLGFETIMFHAPSNHTLDPPSKNEVFKITRKLVETLKGSGGTRGFLCKEPFKIRGGRWELTVVPLFPAPLIIISREGGIDDLPVEINDYAESEAVKYGFNDVIVVEAHNSMVKGEYRVPDDELKMLRLLISEALSRCKGGGVVEFETSFSKVTKSSLSHCNDVCSEGVSVMSIFTNTTSLCLCSIDGNNMLPKFRLEVVNRCSKIGYNIVEVTTTDSHELTGRLPGGEGYLPVGSSCWNETLAIILKACIENMKSKRPCEIRYYRINIDNVKVLGVKGMNIIKDAIEKSAVYAAKTFPLMFIFTTLIPIPLTFLV